MKAEAYQRQLATGGQRARHRAPIERLYYRSIERRDLVGIQGYAQRA